MALARIWIIAAAVALLSMTALIATATALAPTPHHAFGMVGTVLILAALLVAFALDLAAMVRGWWAPTY